MTALEDALAALASYDAAIEDTGQNPDIVNRQDAPHLAFVLRALIAEHERLIAATNPRKTIAQISAYEAAVSIRAREIVDTRKVFEAVATPPTDDDREALAELRSDLNSDTRLGYHWARLILAAGFRRQGPITDDEREALAGIAREAWAHYQAIQDDPEFGGDFEDVLAYRLGLAGFRRQGPPTDANPQAWQYGVLGGFPERVMGPMSSRASAENLCGDDLARLMRRRPGVAPGPWEPVETDAD